MLPGASLRFVDVLPYGALDNPSMLSDYEPG